MIDAGTTQERPRRLSVAALAGALVLSLLCGQALSDRLTPTAGTAPTGRLLGRAAFAYLTGLRTFAAAALFVRIEPVQHGYYDDKSLKEQLYAVPTLRIVVALDPQFIQAYYIAPLIVAQTGHVHGAFQLAREGVANNPRAALLRASLAELLALSGGDMREARRHAYAAFAPDAFWGTVQDKFDGYVALRFVYHKLGQRQMVGWLQDEIRWLQTMRPDSPAPPAPTPPPLGR